jgi:hypothetical protein
MRHGAWSMHCCTLVTVLSRELQGSWVPVGNRPAGGSATTGCAVLPGGICVVISPWCMHLHERVALTHKQHIRCACMFLAMALDLAHSPLMHHAMIVFHGGTQHAQCINVELTCRACQCNTLLASCVWQRAGADEFYVLIAIGCGAKQHVCPPHASPGRKCSPPPEAPAAVLSAQYHKFM